MLKRNDLVKQFDLVVKQEIKNHNDQILESNILMNKVLGRLDDYERSYQRDSLDLKEQIAQLKKEHHNLNCCQSNQHDKQIRSQKSLDNYEKNFYRHYQEIQDDILDVHLDLEEIWNVITLFEDNISSIREDIVQQSKQSKYDVEQLRRFLEKKIQQVDESFQCLPCKSVEEIEEHNRQLKAIQFSIKCLYEEMENHKEKRFYNEKQVEHAFNLIGRLKKQVEL